MKSSARKIHKWPAERENHKCFINANFPFYGTVYQYTLDAS